MLTIFMLFAIRTEASVLRMLEGSPLVGGGGGGGAFTFAPTTGPTIRPTTGPAIGPTTLRPTLHPTLLTTSLSHPPVYLRTSLTP